MSSGYVTCSAFPIITGSVKNPVGSAVFDTAVPRIVDTASQELGSTAQLGAVVQRPRRHRLLFHQAVAIPDYFLEQ